MGFIVRSFRNTFTNYIIYLLLATFSVYPALEYTKNSECCIFCDEPKLTCEDVLYARSY